jgi:putative queuosine salvage protein
MSLPDDVREHAAQVAARATSVRVDVDALGAVIGSSPPPPPALDPDRHFLEGSEADVASYLLALDTINFGSGWWPTLRKRADGGRPMSGYFTVASRLADRFRAHGPWSNAELRALRADEVADVLHQARDHELMALFAQALRQLGAWLGERHALDVVREAGRSAVRLAETLAGGMAMYDDRGFYKRAQIVPSDLALAGVARFDDLDRLTIFADNLVPHVLRVDGVLRYDARLAAHIDAGRLLRPGPQEREIRAGAVHACVLLAERLGVDEQTLDHWLWTRGQQARYKAVPRHRCRTVFY